MSESSRGALPEHTSNSVRVPEYRVTRRTDQSLSFDPPAGSRELANALSMKYPLCNNLEQQMQSAFLDFISSEAPEEHASQKYTFTSSEERRQSLPSSVLPIESSASKPYSPEAAQSNFQASVSVWNIITGKPVEKKRNRVKYNAIKRSKVAKVRKFGACDFHRKKKTEVYVVYYPRKTTCSQFKVYL
jgi:hypothetical protein